MSELNKPYSFYTLFRDKFPVARRELGRKPDQLLTKEATENFLSEEIEVMVTEVVIPKMQRDYAQGRSNEAEVRENFLQALYDAIADDTLKKRCSLNFIYGHFIESKDKVGAVSFVPYDGQQRLTTLYLLYWYASRKECVSEDFLRGFRYDTRFSSTTFTTMFLSGIQNLNLSCEEAEWLSGLGAPDTAAGKMVPAAKFGGRGTLSQWLMNKNGFARSWLEDPTISGMLEVLDAIHAKFHELPGMWQRLCEEDPTRMPIYFYFQKVSHALDAGSIFIKMNSRGKLLTEFECFKADFLRLLRTGNYPADKRDDIAKKIDKTWEQTFWELAKRRGIKETDTDVLLMRYVNFVIDLMGFERNLFQSRNPRLQLYNAERLKKVMLSTDGGVDESALHELMFSVDTWCGDNQDNRADEYFQRIFRKDCNESSKESIKLFFKPDPSDFFQTIILGKELTLNAVAMFHAVLVARAKRLSADDCEVRLRSVRNLVYFMDKGVTELPYILQKVRLVMENGLSVDFKNEKSQRKFTDAQIREEQFKEWLASKDATWHDEIRKLEESEWFKGQIGALLPEALETSDEKERLLIVRGPFAKRLELFKRLFCSGDVSDSLIRKALFYTLDDGYRYWVSSKGWYWMGASTDDFAWTAARPYFTREGNSQGDPQSALRKLLDHPFFEAASGSGVGLWQAFVNRLRPDTGAEGRPFDVVYYLGRYYDAFFERWTQMEAAGRSKCVGRILYGCDGLSMQMLDGKTRSSPYWDPYLYVALKEVDPNSIVSDGQGAFNTSDLIKQYGAWDGCWIVHRDSQTKILYGDYGVHIKTSRAFFETIRIKLESLNIDVEQIEQAADSEEAGTWFLRTRVADDKLFRDNVDRIEVCKKLLTIIKDTTVQSA